jgi:hypothetical protein
MGSGPRVDRLGLQGEEAGDGLVDRVGRLASGTMPEAFFDGQAPGSSEKWN